MSRGATGVRPCVGAGPNTDFGFRNEHIGLAIANSYGKSARGSCFSVGVIITRVDVWRKFYPRIDSGYGADSDEVLAE